MQDAEECPIGLRVIRNFGVIPGVTNCAVLRDSGTTVSEDYECAVQCHELRGAMQS
jgi:hypothetical protein